MEKLTPKQVEEILARKAESRYKYFLRTAASEEEVWGLSDEEGWLMLEDDTDGTDVLPVFPSVEFAELFQEKGEFTDFKVEALDLYEFLEWMDDMTENNIKVGVFPTPDFQCAVIPPERLMADFQDLFDKEQE